MAEFVDDILKQAQIEVNARLDDQNKVFTQLFLSTYHIICFSKIQINKVGYYLLMMFFLLFSVMLWINRLTHGKMERVTQNFLLFFEEVELY